MRLNQRAIGVQKGKVTGRRAGKKMLYERDTICRIHEAVMGGSLPEPFRPVDVNKALKITFAGTFLPKHRVGNPGGNTELFVQIERGLYQLK